MSEALKPCPKCGSPNIIREAFVPEWAVVHWRHKCEDCGHEGPGARTVAWAAKLWNRRANEATTCPPTVTQGIVDEISKRLEVPQDERLLRVIYGMLHEGR